MKLHELSHAIADLQVVLQLDPTFAKAYRKCALIYEEQEQNDKSLEYYGKAIELNHGYIGAYNDRAMLYPPICMLFLFYIRYVNLGKLESALQDITKTIDIDPTDDMSWNNRAGVYSKMGQHFSAIENATHAITLNPSNANAYHSPIRLFTYFP